MIRYRCPHCAALTVAHERRAGQPSVCRVCVKMHPIPADKSLWLNESGELLYPPALLDPAPIVVPPGPDPTLELPTTDRPEPTVVPPLPEPPTHDPDLLATVPDLQLPEPPDPAPFERPVPSPMATVREPEDEPHRERHPEPEPELSPASVDAGWTPSLGLRGPRNAPAAPDPHEAAGSEPDAVVTLTPPSAPSPLPTRHPPVSVSTPSPWSAPAPHATSEAIQLQTQADIAVALTAALTSRMKPPAAPRRDLRPSTAGWMLLTGLGVALVFVALFAGADYRWALAVGVIQIVVGYLWIVRLTHLRDPQRGTLCAIPPLTLIYLVQYKYAKLRPLRFIATGAAIAALALLTPRLTPHTQSLFRGAEEEPVVQPDLATQPKLAQLRSYTERKAYDPLMKLLDVLAKTDPLLSEDAADRAELAVELRGLCQHADTGVKVRAMSAYARWDPDGARAVCLAAVRSPSSEERKRALELLPHWRDHDSARAAQSLIGRPGTVETNQAKAALEEIGGPPAEEAAWALLNRADEQATKLTALAVLEKVGGAKTAVDLHNYATASEDDPVRKRAEAVAKAIEARLHPSTPTP